MYLKGSKYNLKKRRRRRRTNPALIILLLALIGLVWYFNQYVVPPLTASALPAATPTANAEALVTEAQQQFQAGNLFRAISAYQQAILADPANAGLHVELARLQVLAGQAEAAETSARNGLILSPDNPRAHAVLGWALHSLGRSVDAEREFIEALTLDPDLAEAHAFYAELLADQQLFERAGDSSRRALELNPNLLEVRRARAYVLELTANYEEAALEYQAALRINDRIPSLHLGLGRTYWALEDIDAAIDEFNLADALNPLDPLPDAYIARIYLQNGEFAKAVQFAKKAAEDEPTNPRRYALWGVALYRNQQYNEAIEAFALAIHGGLTPNNQPVAGLALDYDVAEYYYMYGLALARARRCPEALPIFQAIIAGIPGHEIAQANAQAGMDICEQQAASPITPTPDPAATPTP
ncbi:MAG: tetratricopeptide repeat protein [Chloroflexi bacterium]|nr:tetratricopeptide repeat protein [Chloroflexota bacterium]